jgi:hypothetical protein
MADFGFSPSFVRAIAYARAGRISLETSEGATGIPNEELLAEIYSVMRRAYGLLTLCVLCLAAVIGSLALAKPISELAHPGIGWLAWAVVALCSAINFRNTMFATWLQGLNEVALLRRTESILVLGSTSVTAVGILLSKQFFASVAIAQLSMVAVSFGLRALALKTAPRDIRPCDLLKNQVFQFIWPAAWRSGVGVAMSSAIIQASGVIYAQCASAQRVAPYLFAMRIMQMIVQTSMAPFYSKIPWFASLYGAGKFEELVPAARKAMARCHWVFIAGVLGIAAAVPTLLKLLGSRTEFVPLSLWMVMGVAFLIERIGAMHMQFYSLSNHILWHVANGISGTLYIAGSLLFFKSLNVYAFPVAMILAYLGFYTWFSARLVYRHYEVSPLSFEARSSLAPGVLSITFLLLSFL